MPQMMPLLWSPMIISLIIILIIITTNIYFFFSPLLIKINSQTSPLKNWNWKW